MTDIGRAELAFLRGTLEEGLYAASTQTTTMKPPDSITLGHPIHKAARRHVRYRLLVEGYRFILTKTLAMMRGV
jgi:hypothetical protein